ncbi:glycosyltransferase family 4 protein [Pelosinus fermentans]|uniref:Glycosyl transferase group 1 n=1 Tax=Pelosinus fermentans B4 TaxID=1149862 RepID=I9AST0_9FIRM|nr:glycosyltransferase family 4 protein [Pelosinus fermentans]EIW16012.1 glycosyl transferase group 1 [Pelosinus fermentans B4]EIW27282.1 glycosyl transferase group 1 [Pelosinus fermentans A11]
MKNILLIVPRLNIGGAETYVATVALGLKERGFNVFVASGGGILARSIAKKGIKHCFLPIRVNAMLAAYLLEKIIKKYRIDVIHANSAAAGIVAVKVKQKINIPVVYTAHGVFGHNAKEMRINDCDRIICVSEFVRQYAIKKGFLSEKLLTVYSGIDLHKFQPNLKKTQVIRKNSNIPEDSFTIAIVSRIKNLRNKGHADILSILERYKGAENWHLMVIGKGKGMWSLQYHIWKKHLSNRVHTLGHIVNVQEVLDGCDAVVLPSMFETFGLVLAEAMAMEKPVITYAVGGTPEVIHDQHTGYLVEKDNIGELYEKLAILASDKTRCYAMGKKGRLWVRDKFSSDVMMDKVISIYQELLSR